MSSAKKLTKKDEEALELGKKLQQFYETGYVNKKQALSFTFVKAVITGFGIFLGGTILVALVLWILGFFDQIPLIEHIVRVINSGLQ